MIKEVLVDPTNGKVIGQQFATHSVVIAYDDGCYDLWIGRSHALVTTQQLKELRELLNSAEILEASNAVQR